MSFIKKIIYNLIAIRNYLSLSKKIALIYRSLPFKIEIAPEQFGIHRNIWGRLNSKPNLKWYKTYASINQIDDPRYITEIDYYNKVEPVLNNRTFSEAYCDKNFYHKYLDKNLLPDVYLRNIHGVYYTVEYKIINNLSDVDYYIPKEANKIIVKKAVDSGGGHGVDLFTKHENAWINKDGNVLTRKYLEQIFIKNFLIQEYIDQHPFYIRFNASSVNTVRLLTYRSVKDNEIYLLQAVLRIGSPGSFVDNQASGGIACGIESGGKPNYFAVNKKGEKFENYNDIVFKDLEPLFKYKEIVNIALTIAKAYHYHRLLGFDFCIDITGSIKLIEINNKNNEINFYQMNNGPLFKDYTNEIIEYCTRTKKTVCIDFDI